MKFIWGIFLFLLLIVECAMGQRSSLTVDQIIDKYVETVGDVDKFSAIQSWTEKAEVTGDLRNLVPLFSAPMLAKEHGTLESYYKAPNLRLTFVRTDKNAAAIMFGCDGAVGWYFAPELGFREYKPNPGHEGICKTGFAPLAFRLRQQKAEMKLDGQKDIGGRRAFVVKAEMDKIHFILYFDVDNYLLVRTEQGGQFRSITLYSDYRDVNGIKIPFQTIFRTENKETITKLLKVEVNAPIDDKIFQKPKLP